MDQNLLASIEKVVAKLKQQKLEASKLRRQSERKLKEAKSLARRSSSGLHSVQRRLEDTREKLGEINAEFTQFLARKESLERLIKAAHDRLTQEMEAKEQVQIDLENADTQDEKQTASERLAQITEKIQELKSELKQRESASQKLIPAIEGQKKTRSKTSQQIHKQVQTKPTLVTLIKKGTTDSERLARRVEIATKKEASIGKILQEASKKLEELLAKKRREAAKKAALKRAAMKRALALKRKKAAKKRALALKLAALKRKRAMKKKYAKRAKKPKATKKSKPKKSKSSKKKSRR
jgi:hypothetical protein